MIADGFWRILVSTLTLRVQGLPSPWHRAAVLPPLPTLLPPKLNNQNLRSSSPNTHRALQGFPSPRGRCKPGR